MLTVKCVTDSSMLTVKYADRRMSSLSSVLLTDLGFVPVEVDVLTRPGRGQKRPQIKEEKISINQYSKGNGVVAKDRRPSTAVAYKGGRGEMSRRTSLKFCCALPNFAFDIDRGQCKDNDGS